MPSADKFFVPKVLINNKKVTTNSVVIFFKKRGVCPVNICMIGVNEKIKLANKYYPIMMRSARMHDPKYNWLTSVNIISGHSVFSPPIKGDPTYM
jgi:hypothetical protein